MNVKLFSNLVMVEPKVPDDTTQDGIIVSTADSRNAPNPREGVVVACGPGRRGKFADTIPMSVKPGDRVRFKTHGWDIVTVDGKKYLVMAEEYILAIIEEE